MKLTTGTTFVLVSCLALLIAACSGGLPGSTTPVPNQITSPEEAAKLVLRSDPRFAGIGPRDPNLIGQANWYEVTTADAAYQVVVRMGWGDCPAGCINEHRWTYSVDRSGAVRLVAEAGDPVPSEEAGGGGGQLGISGLVLAGPICPVEKNPPDPNCADRPVGGAVLVINDETGSQVARLVSAPDGTFSIALPAGHYVLVPQPVEGLLGKAGPIDFRLAPGGPPPTLDVRYDTGIR